MAPRSPLKFPPLLLALSALCVGPVAADAAYARGLCLGACQNAFRSVRFGDADPDLDPEVQPCQGGLGLVSLYLCMDVHCEAAGRDDGLALLSETCGEAMPSLEIIANYTAEDIARMRRLEMDDPPEGEALREPAIPSEGFFELWFGTLDSVGYVNLHHYWYGWAMGIFWGFVLAIGALFRFLPILSHRSALLHADRRRSSNSWPTVAWFRRRVLMPATFGYRCSQNVGWCTIPPRIQTLTILAFAFINVVLSVRGYRLFPGNIYYPTITQQILRYASDRTGIISFANFPLLWLFGMRNNVVIWLTGWDFGTYNNFHRWVARIATVQAVVHSVGYTVLILREGGWTNFASWWTIWFWWAGELATVIMCGVVAFSFYWMRRQQYEGFLAIHIGLSVLLLLTMLGHVSIFDGEYDAMFWIPAFIWMLDRLLRVCRVVAFNPKAWDTHGLATYDAASNVVRLTIPTQTSAYDVSPGTHFYLMVLSDSRFWESHPFTVASVSHRGTGAAKTLGEQEAPLLATEQADASQNPEDADESEGSATEMTFLIRPYDSLTLRLKEKAEADWPKPASVRVLVDGPYGHTRPLHLFDRTVFIVGGSGIVVPLSYLHKLTTGNPRPRSVEVHWAVREPAFAVDVLRKDCGEILDHSHVSMDMYFTSTAGRSDVPELPQQVRRHMGRLDARNVVFAAVEGAGGGSVAVVACGPARVADDTRRAVVESMGRGTAWIEYFEESFQW